MTTTDPTSSPFAAAATSPSRTEGGTGQRGWWLVEEMLERGSERLNPILVKEGRQALKSKQFVITFTLLLLAGWVWSLLGVALLSPGVYYAPGGRFMLAGYFIILAIPVLVIVPFSAFRSLASEREDGTFELLSITALSSRQIVTGKLGSAVLQMLVYYSALAPCIAFTYLLRGIDIVTIAFLLFYTLVASVMLSSAGLVVATITRARHWQVVLSVLLLIGLLIVTVFWIMSFVSLIVDNSSVGFDEVDFWLIQAAVITFCISHTALFVLVAGAQISFVSDNRSTRLRVMLVVQQVLWIGWMMFFWIHFAEEFYLPLLVSVAAIYWFLAGAIMMGETATLSPRVKRSLPQSFLGRMCLTWFNPGSGTGYTFAVSNLLGLVLVTVIAGLVGTATGFRGVRTNLFWLWYVLLAAAYVVIYLGLGRLLVVALQRVTRITMLLTALLNLFLVVLGVALPLFMHAWRSGYGQIMYSFAQISNWAWTLSEVSRGRLLTFSEVPLWILSSAAIVLLLNLVFAMIEVEQVRSATPERVLQDDHELQAETAESRLSPRVSPLE